MGLLRLTPRPGRLRIGGQLPTYGRLRAGGGRAKGERMEGGDYAGFSKTYKKYVQAPFILRQLEGPSLMRVARGRDES